MPPKAQNRGERILAQAQPWSRPATPAPHHRIQSSPVPNSAAMPPKAQTPMRAGKQTYVRTNWFYLSDDQKAIRRVLPWTPP